MGKMRAIKTTTARLVGFFLVFFSLFFSLAFSAYAGYGTHLNVSMSEVVYQNVTFAKDFYLVENQTYCRIDGTLNITNPNTEAIYDIYISYRNVNRLTSDFLYTDGRNGSMWSGGAGITRVLGKIGNNTNNYSLYNEEGMDLDNDHEYDDYVWVNSTHIIFNLSSESGLIAIRLKNGTNDVNIGSVPAYLNMNEIEINGSNRTYGNITIVGTVTTANILDAENVTVTIKEYYEGPIVIHIPELRGGEYTTFTYNITCTDTDPPVDITTEYSNPRTGYNRKVLAGYNWTINQTVGNFNYLGTDVTNLNITIVADTVPWNDTIFNFTLEYLYPVGDSGNVSGNGTNKSRWVWNVAGGTLAWNTTQYITYIVGAPLAVPFTATYRAIVETISYESAFLMSNLTIIDINASAALNFSFQKRIERPADNALSHNVTWEIRPEVRVPVNITYDLNKVTLWVTNNLDPTNTTTSFGELRRVFNESDGIVKEINITTSWGNSSYYWYFNYTDGYNASYPPPIVWMEPQWVITNKYGQILNFSRTISGNDVYLKYIYVVHGYWLEIEKNITNVGQDQYRIRTYVENIGNGWTPRYEYVTVYDFVPSEFTAYNFSVTTDFINLSVGTPGSPYYGKAYRWNIPWKGTMNSSLGPKYGPYATGAANYSWSVTYLVNGSGAYKVSELYIVGLDPLRVDGASASPVIAVISSLQSYSKEILYVGIVAFLIIINITNLIITSKINKKL